jgi:glycosyltransferase involved in cell wall biosynthesis
MHQRDFSKIQQMNIHSNVVFANQCDRTSYEEIDFDGKVAKMISTETRGVGKNRNIALTYATADILLLSDDDMCYTDTYAEDILLEFEKYPDADVIIFNILSNDDKRKQVENKKVKKLKKISRMPYGAPRIALRRDAWQKSNVWFTTLFGGGAKYTNGEDSMFLNALRRSGLTIYVSNVFIGTVDMSTSCWYNGVNEEYFFNKGAYLKAMKFRFSFFWEVYYVVRLKSYLPIKEKFYWIKKGKKAFKEQRSYSDLK